MEGIRKVVIGVSNKGHFNYQLCSANRYLKTKYNLSVILYNKQGIC